MSGRLLGFVCVLVLVAPGLVGAEIPPMISYQGKVTDSGGVPVPDGDYPMWFTLYDVDAGGAPLWDSGDTLLALAGGVFNILLGAGTAGGGGEEAG